jgi:phosphoribosylanthranilate isomerase
MTGNPDNTLEVMIRIKICGVTTPEEACMAAEAGADAVGLNFYPPSPRFVTPSQAAAIVRALPAFTAPVGVFVEKPLRQACAMAFQLGLRAIQTYDDPPATEDPFPFAHIPAFRVQSAEQLAAIASWVRSAQSAGRGPAAVLIDAHVPGQFGGTGRPAPWELLAEADLGTAVILAGGLTPDNVGQAIRLVRPWGVDVASGVESAPGRKDPARVAEFVKAAQEAAQSAREA